jgi:hypothetical protein
MSAQQLSSPNGKITMAVADSTATVYYNQQKVLDMKGAFISPLTTHYSPLAIDYTMLSGKRSHCTNQANEYQVGGMTIRLYNDGVAIREKSQTSNLTYIIPEGTRRWMQQWCDSYEGFFPSSTTYKVAPVPSYSGTFKSLEGYCNRWGYPALIETSSPLPSKGLGKVYTLITEANIEKGHSASCLFNDGERYRVVPDEAQPSTISPQPWRVIIVGSLADIVESTLVTDVSEPSKIADTSWIHPGVVSWVYWAYNHGSNDYQIIKQYVDLAVSLQLPYVLIDAEWDQMKDGYTIEHAIRYAKAMGVKPLIWYNSSVGWVDGAPTPKFRLNKPEDREKEFAWCERLGVAGVKIDFFSGDNQKNMDYCIDLLECAARHHLLVNFHGATVPRGWQRTYPNLLSTEGVYGAEWYNNVPTFTDKAASHNATLPFTRNVIGPMDYTPCAFSDSQHPHITSHAHELALTVLFESGLQHLADRPESFLSQPAEIRQFLSTLPAAWDDTRFVCGYPGEYAVLARRCGDTWYLAGINGTDKPKTIQLPDGEWNKRKKGNVTIYADGSNWQISTRRDVPKSIKCIPRGGFIVKITPQ